ncbi:MAG: RDD family protein, partial [Phycisphaerales bacterium]
GPVLVVRSAEGASAWLLTDSRWRELIMPSEVKVGLATADSVHVLGSGDSVSLLVGAGEEWNQWSAGLSWPAGAVDVESGERVSTIWDAPEGPLPLDWARRSIPALGSTGGEVMRVFLFADTLVATRWRDPDGLSLEILDPVTGWKSVARAAQVPRRCASVPLFDASHLLVAWTAEDDRGRLSRRGWEVAIPGAAVLHDGPLKLGGPVSRSEYRLLVLILLMVTSSTLAFVLTPEERRAFQLPFGFSLPRTSRRVAAAALDVALCVAISQGVFAAFGPGSGPANQGSVPFFDSLLGALVCAVVLGVTSETVSGRTPGKLVMGLRVIAVVRASSGEPIAQLPALGRVLARNLLKWAALPLALLGLLDSGGRGRPDQIAGTVVAVADEDESDPDEESP